MGSVYFWIHKDAWLWKLSFRLCWNISHLLRKIKNMEFFPKTCFEPTHFSSEQNHKFAM